MCINKKISASIKYVQRQQRQHQRTSSSGGCAVDGDGDGAGSINKICASIKKISEFYCDPMVFFYSEGPVGPVSPIRHADTSS